VLLLLLLLLLTASVLGWLHMGLMNCTSARSAEALAGAAAAARTTTRPARPCCTVRALLLARLQRSCLLAWQGSAMMLLLPHCCQKLR
jgi:hypothetical protein